MTPYYQDDAVTIYHGDCREIVPRLSFDVAITDPPFNAKTHQGARGAKGRHGLISFDDVSEDQFVKDCLMLVDAAARWVVMTCNYSHAVAAEKVLGKKFIRLGVWTKNDPAPQFTGDRPATGWEAVAILHREGPKKWNGGGKPAVWRTNIIKNGALHPTEKPISLAQSFVELFSNAGETIVDPYMGSGTTLRAAKNLGRKSVGIEIDERCCEIAAHRMAQEVFSF